MCERDVATLVAQFTLPLDTSYKIQYLQLITLVPLVQGCKLCKAENMT